MIKLGEKLKPPIISGPVFLSRYFLIPRNRLAEIFSKVLAQLQGALFTPKTMPLVFPGAWHSVALRKVPLQKSAPMFESHLCQLCDPWRAI